MPSNVLAIGLLRTDTGSYSRLLVSLGIAAIAIAFGVPWLYLREIDVLKITRTDMSALSPVARETLRARQHLLHNLQPWAVVFLVTFLLLGLASLVLGMKRMRTQQVLEDRKLAAETAREEASIETQSPEEHDDRIAEDQRLAAIVATDAPVALSRPPNPPSPERAVELEQQVLGWVEKRLPSDYLLHRNPKVVSDVAQRSLLFDGLLRHKTGEAPDVVIEIKISRLAARPVRMFADQLIAYVTRYRDATGRQALAWLILVIDNPEVDEVSMRQTERRFRLALEPHGSAQVVRADRLEEIRPLSPDQLSLAASVDP